jgi:hypothetical protein
VREEVIVISAEEIKSVTSQLEVIMTEISESAVMAFDVIRRHPFYEVGTAKEMMDRVFYSEMRKDLGEYELLVAAPDMLGKIQSLVLYYNLMNEYCIDAIVRFKELDEQMAKLYDEKIGGFIND